jgi:hypothetical protein
MSLLCRVACSVTNVSSSYHSPISFWSLFRSSLSFSGFPPLPPLNRHRVEGRVGRPLPVPPIIPQRAQVAGLTGPIHMGETACRLILNKHRVTSESDLFHPERKGREGNGERTRSPISILSASACRTQTADMWWWWWWWCRLRASAVGEEGYEDLACCLQAARLESCQARGCS